MGGAEFLIPAGLGALQTVQRVAESRREAARSEQQAGLAQAAAAAEAEQARREARRAAGRGRARIGAAGITVEGAPVEVLAELAAEGERDARAIEAEGAATAAGHRFRARQAQGRAGQELLSGTRDVADALGRGLR